jgi:hypothetical protein
MSEFLDLGIEDKMIDAQTSDDYYTPPFIFEALRYDIRSRCVIATGRDRVATG